MSIRIVPHQDGYDVYRGDEYITTTRSLAAAVEEKRTLLKLADTGIEVSYVEDDGTWDFIKAGGASRRKLGFLH